MRAVCARCGTDLTGGPEQDPATPISHGICDDCAEFFLASRPEPLREFAERLDEPVLLVDRNAVVLAANSAPAATAYLDRHTPEGIRRIRLRISTECQNECVVLRLEEAGPDPEPQG